MSARPEPAPRTHCPVGHPYDDANTYHYVTPQGWKRRCCRACNRAAVAKRAARLRAAKAPITTEDRFWAKVQPEPNTGCWFWTGSINASGYGAFTMERRSILAHRYSYLLHAGPLLEGLEIDHLCRVRSCVNPDHLEQVTRQVNISRSDCISVRNARKTACPRCGQPFVRTARGTRRCPRHDSRRVAR